MIRCEKGERHCCAFTISKTLFVFRFSNWIFLLAKGKDPKTGNFLHAMKFSCLSSSSGWWEAFLFLSPHSLAGDWVRNGVWDEAEPWEDVDDDEERLIVICDDLGLICVTTKAGYAKHHLRWDNKNGKFQFILLTFRRGVSEGWVRGFKLFCPTLSKHFNSMANLIPMLP